MSFDTSKPRNTADFVVHAQRDLPDGSTAQQVITVDETTGNKLKINADGSINAGLVVEHIDIGNVGVLDSVDNRINPAKEDGNLATIASKDFATQTTLAEIKAKTDNLDVALSTRTKPADIQKVQEQNPITGYATSAKQLPDNHQVTVSNIASTPVITGYATSAKQLPDNHQVTVSNQITLPTDYPLPASQVTTLTPPAAITGYATSAKQLPDNHQVTVSNIASTPVITGFATENKQDSQITLETALNSLVTILNSTVTTNDKTHLLLQQIRDAIAMPPNWVEASNAPAVFANGGTFGAVTTVGTVTTLANQTNLGGFSADMMTENNSFQDWGLSIRSLII